MVNLSSLKDTPAVTILSQQPCPRVAVWPPGDAYICPKGGGKQAGRRTDSSVSATTSETPWPGGRSPTSDCQSLILSAPCYSFSYRWSQEKLTHTPLPTYQTEATPKGTAVFHWTRKRRWWSTCQTGGKGGEGEACAWRQT